MTEVEALRREIEELRQRVADAEQALGAFSRGEIDAVAHEPGASPVLLRAAQDRLRESERLLRAIFDGALDALLLADDDGRCLDANPAACKLFGLEREELSGRRIAEFADREQRNPSDWAGFLQTVNHAGHFRLLRLDGEKRDLDFRSSANILPGVHLAVFRDVTDRRLAEARFQALIEKSSDVVMLSNADSVIVYASPSIQRVLGYDPERLVGRPLSELIHPDDRQRIADKRHALLTNRTAVATVEWRIRHDDGSWRWVESTARNLLDDPAVQAIISNFRDITDRKLGLEMQARLAAIVESSEDAIISEDLESVITSWNRGAERLFGWASSEALGVSTAVLIPPELRAHERRMLELALGGELVEPYRTRRLRKGGDTVEVSVTVSPIRGSAGAVSGASRIARDLTEQRRAEAALQLTQEQLRQAQKMEAVGVLAGGVAHDFNNLLSVVVSYAALLLDQMTPSDPLRSDIEEIRRAGERATDLTRQLLAFSRQQVLQPQVVDLSNVVLGMERMLRRLLSADIELSLLMARSAALVYADPNQVEQIIMNLVVNARDAMPDGGKLTVETVSLELDESYAARHHGVTPGAYVMLAVTDTGVGMDAAVRERIFEPFFTTKDKSKGTGLGLSTVFGIVNQSHGHIWVYSELHHGTTFKVYLPRPDGGSTATRSVHGPALTLRGSETVLLVEDDEQVRVVTRSILRRHGYNVLETENAGEAFLTCEKFAGEIHLLLTDVVMPRMSGRELAERLAAMRPRMKVLYFSGYTENSIVRHGTLDPSVAFLSKPITPDALLRKVREVLDATEV